MIHPFLQEKLPAINKLFSENHVKNAYAFGSVCTNKFNEHSDVDLLINMDEDLEPLVRGELMLNVWDALEEILSRRVDLLSEKSLTNPYFIEELNEKKVLVYGKRS
jgi:predicted nucleotidyltransferase